VNFDYNIKIILLIGVEHSNITKEKYLAPGTFTEKSTGEVLKTYKKEACLMRTGGVFDT
jgi:hypothetical protein